MTRNLCVCLALTTLTVTCAESAEAPGASTSAVCSYGQYAADTYSPSPAFPNQTRAPVATSSKYQVQVVATGLEHPWAMAFLPDGRMLVTERAGRMRIVERNGVVDEPLTGLPRIRPYPGLMDVILDPQFATNRTLYFNYFEGETLPREQLMKAWAEWVVAAPSERSRMNIGIGRVASARLSADGKSLRDIKTLAEGMLDGRLRIAADGSLLITSGTPATGNAPVGREPQDLTNAYGKVLRINRDGSTPADNPFATRSDVRHDIFTYGLRDPQGAAIHPRTGELWTSEHGPRGGDEINIHRAGRNYGFPIISYGREYSGDLINQGLSSKQDMQQPLYFWVPSIAPSGITFYTANLFPEWRGNLFVAALAGKRLVRLVLEGEQVIAHEDMLLERCQRLRAVYQGSDGALYVLTDEDAGQILKIVPQQN